jgi:hypothetical protein
MFSLPNVNELLILAVVIIVLSATGLWPRIMQGLRELRGEAPPRNDMSTQEMEMCYKILGLSPGCTWDEIEKAYRRKAQIHHPDKGGDEDAMRVLNDVYNRLKRTRRGNS